MSRFSKAAAVTILVYAVGFVVIPAAAFADCTMTNDNTDYTSAAENMTSLHSATQVTATCDGYAAGITVGVKNAGGLPPNYTMEIWSDDGSDNPLALLGSADTTLGLGVGGTCGPETVSITSSIPIVNGSLYWVDFHADTPSGYPNDLVWCNDGVTSTGHYKTSSDGSSWAGSDPAMYTLVSVTTADPSAGGGGGTSTTSTSTVSSLEQSQTNLAYAFFIFLASMFFMVWLMRKH